MTPPPRPKRYPPPEFPPRRAKLFAKTPPAIFSPMLGVLGLALALRMARALYDPTLPAATLCYVADPRVPAGTLMASPYTGRVQVMVIRSSAQPGAWWDEDRDLGADFQQAFGAEYGPGMPPLAAVVAS